MSEKCTHEESEEVGAIWLRCNACGHHFERPKKSVSDGAKTGTPRKLCLYCQYPVANKKEWDEIPGGEGDHLCWGECNERNDVDSLLRKSRSALTEALKVAGEALRFIEREARELDSSGDEISAKQMKAFASERRAALERIRTKGTIPKAAPKEHETEPLYPDGGFDFGGPEGEGW